MILSRLLCGLTVVTWALAGMTHTAAAQTATASAGAPSVKVSVDLGLVAASGNTDLRTFSFGQQLQVVSGKWTVTQLARMVNSETRGRETANEYAVSVQPSYVLSRRWKGYLLAGWDRNPFLGISQRFQEGAGLSFAALDGPKHSLVIDAGFSYFQQDFTDGTSSSFPTARSQASYKYTFAPKAHLQDVLLYLPNLDNGPDYRVNNEVSLVAPLAGWLALKARYLLQYQHLPQPGFGTTDNLYTTGLQVTF